MIELASHESTAWQPGLHALAVDAVGERIALCGVVEGEGVLLTLDFAGNVLASVYTHTFLDRAHGPQAIAFDATRELLWLSAESDDSAILVALEASTLRALGRAECGAFPPPAAHELWAHPSGNAVTLLASCGQDGTWINVARYANSRVALVLQPLAEGTVPVGLAGAVRDGASVFLVSDTAVEKRAWPTFALENRLEFDESFIGSYAGAVLGDTLLVAGEDADDGRALVLACDATPLQARRTVDIPASATWAGAVGDEHIVTLDASADPSDGAIWRVEPALLAPA